MVELSDKPSVAKIQRAILALPDDEYFRFMKWFRESYSERYGEDLLGEDVAKMGRDARSDAMEVS